MGVEEEGELPWALLVGAEEGGGMASWLTWNQTEVGVADVTPRLGPCLQALPGGGR